MLRSSSLILFLLYSLFSVAQQRHELGWKHFESLAFYSGLEDYSTDSIFFYHAFLKHDNGEKGRSKQARDEQARDEQDRRAKGQSIQDHSDNFSFQAHARPLDLYDYWDKKGDEQYHVLMTKVGYVLDKPVAFFSKERLSDPNYISQTIPEAKIRKTGSVFHISTGFGAPEIDYTLHFFTPEDFDRKFPDTKDYFNKYDGLDISPSQVVVQHNYHYGKVMFQKTSKMSVSISRYFALNPNQTLVVNYTLNYILNFPPDFVGGDEFLIKKIQEGIKTLIDETQVVCKTTAMVQ